MQNRANQRQATGNANGTSVNPPAVTATVGQQQTNVSQYPMVSQTMRFATTQQGQTIRVGNPQQTAMQQMTRLHEPQKHTAGGGEKRISRRERERERPRHSIL